MNRCANALRSLGIGKGDRVALFMPMCPELVAAFFAIIKIGGIVLPLFSGYGADAVASRLQDAEVTAIFVADGFWRRGQQVLMKAHGRCRRRNVRPRSGTSSSTSRLGVDVADAGRARPRLGRAGRDAAEACATPSGPTPTIR